MACSNASGCRGGQSQVDDMDVERSGIFEAGVDALDTDYAISGQGHMSNQSAHSAHTGP